MSAPAYTEADAWAEFLKAMAGAGISTRDKISPSKKIIRFNVDGDRQGSKNGWLNFHSDPPASGAFGSFRTGFQDTWTMVNPQRMSEAERASLAQRLQDTKRQRAEELAEAHAMCREAAAAIWAAVEPVSPEHPYLLAKGVRALPGLRQLARDVKYRVADPEKPNRTARKGVIVVPIKGADGTLHSVQTIDGDGRKHFLSGSNKRGHYYSLGQLSPRIIIAEGTSTAASIHMATGCCCVIAFDAGNLMSVARAIRAKYPSHEIVLAADNDRQTTKPVPNPGMTRACEAAAEVGGLVAWPEFDDGVMLPNDSLPTDFNDLAAVSGNFESVVAAFEAAMRPADIENHVGPRRERRVVDAAPSMPEQAQVPAALPIRFQVPEISQKAMDDLRKQGFEWGSEVEVAKAVHGIIKRELASLIFAEDQFWTFAGDCWRKWDQQALRRSLHLLDGSQIDAQSRGNKVLRLSGRMIDGIVRELAVMAADPDFFADPKPGIPAKNCLVTFDREGNVRCLPHDPDHRRRFVINAEFHSPITPTLPPEDSLLHRLFEGAFRGDDDAEAKVLLIAEALGAAAGGFATKVAQPRAIIMYGPSARNGKSSTAALFQALLPPGTVSSLTPAALADERQVVHLAGKAANIADELSGAAVGGEAFKAAVTGDPLTGREVYRSSFTFRPQALHCFTTNKLPSFSGGLDRGLQRRIVVVDFSRSIPVAELIPNIADRIARTELEFLLGLAILGAARLRKNSGFTVPKSSSLAMEDWLANDPFRMWSEQRLVPAREMPAEGWYRTAHLHRDFSEWMRAEGYRDSSIPSPADFGNKLRDVPGFRERKRRADGPRIVGLVLKAQSAGSMYDE